MNEAKNYDKAKSELDRIFGAIGKLEVERLALVDKIQDERIKTGEGQVDSLLNGSTATATASKALLKLQDRLSEIDGTMGALNQRWGAALKVEREAKKALSESIGEQCEREAEAAQREADKLAMKIKELNAVGIEADKRRGQAVEEWQQADEFLSSRVGVFKGTPAELKARLSDDAAFTLNRAQARGLLETWDQGKVVTLRSRIKDKCFPTSVAVFFDRLTGEVLDTRVMSGIGSGNKPLIGVREAKPEELDRIKDRLEMSYK